MCIMHLCLCRQHTGTLPSEYNFGHVIMFTTLICFISIYSTSGKCTGSLILSVYVCTCFLCMHIVVSDENNFNILVCIKLHKA